MLCQAADCTPLLALKKPFKTAKKEDLKEIKKELKELIKMKDRGGAKDYSEEIIEEIFKNIYFYDEKYLLNHKTYDGFRIF